MVAEDGLGLKQKGRKIYYIHKTYDVIVRLKCNVNQPFNLSQKKKKKPYSVLAFASEVKRMMLENILIFKYC